MKQYLILSCFCFCGLFAAAQDEATQVKEAVNLERQLKETDAIVAYRAIVAANPKNLMAMVKCTELDCSLGTRQPLKDKSASYDDALNYAQQALGVDSNSADANYAMALAKSKLIEIETDNKKTIELEREAKMYADIAMTFNPNLARANYLEGKWHYEILNLPWFKLTSARTFHKGFPAPDIDSAITYMEKCRTLDQYFAANYLELAKAYKYKKRPAQAIEVLNKLVKLPNRTANDPAIKAEGQQILSEMQ